MTMSDFIEKFLETRGPCLSSEVAGYLVESLNISPVAARKRVSRLSGNIRRLGYVTFPRKARFLYLERQFGSPRYWENLVEALMQTNSAYGHAIAALRQRGGAVPDKLFPIVCGAPVAQKKHLSPESIFSRLSEAGLLQRVALPGLGDCISIVQTDEHYDFLALTARTQLITESFLLTAVSDWLKKLGIVSYGQVATREAETLPRVGTFAWDLSAPSYLGPMVRVGKNGKSRPGFVVCDVHLGDLITADGVRPFINKCRTLRSLRNIGPCLQIFVGARFQGEAFQLLKANGIVPATPANLFGEEVAEGLLELSKVLHNAAHTSTIDPAEFDALFKKFGKIEGAAAQLRGTLFEYLAADVLRKNGTHVMTNRIYKAEEKKAEADIVAVRENISVTFIECKGHSPYGETPDKEVKRWLQHNVPTFFKAIKAHPDWQNLQVNFEFWTTAPLTSASLAMLEKAKSEINPARYSIKWRLGSNIYDLCKTTKDSGLTAAFRKHFMNSTARSAALAGESHSAVSKFH
ncbi:hypothetical protein [Afifella aestuarii]|uniref:hypothetical protein n=1 Tax=Afifella aestuarii TaxID=1909496 RepID=UPI00196B83B6|nr:hypothetical protein [Afifella aestuarii]